MAYSKGGRLASLAKNPRDEHSSLVWLNVSDEDYYAHDSFNFILSEKRVENESKLDRI